MVIRLVCCQVGEWTYTIRTTAGLQQTITIGVTTRPSSGSRNPVILTAKLGDLDVQFPAPTVISAELTVGDKFVSGANVAALVSRPSLSPVTVMLNDNGVGQFIPQISTFSWLYYNSIS